MAFRAIPLVLLLINYQTASNNMRKGVLLILSFFLISLTTTAKSIDEEKARKIAIDFLTGKRKLKTDVMLCNPYVSTRSSGNNSGYFIFNSTDGQGFAIVTAEDELPEIVGYSTSGHIDNQSMPNALKLFLDSYSQYVEDVRKGIAMAHNNNVTASTDLPAMIEPLVKTQWNQPAPYNLYCPDDCPAGCVAVAMGQIMHYNQWPDVGTGASFTTYNGKAISVDFSKREYRWDLMKNTTKELKEDDEAADAVAKLLFDCGISVKMNYSKDGSGAYENNVGSALFNYFGYKKSTMIYDRPDFYPSKESWIEQIKKELAEQRPIAFFASSPKGGGKDAGGHAFVISGYDDKDMVHVNWGWGGSDDGYYDIFRLDPGSYAFTDNQTAIYGIIPNRDGIDSEYLPIPAMAPIETEANVLSGSATGYESFNVSVGKVFNFNPVSAKWSYGIGLYNDKGEYINKIQKGNYSITFDSYYYRSDLTFVCSLPSGLQDGEYIVKMFFKYSGEFVEPKVEGGSMNNYLRVVIADGKVTIDKEPVTAGITDVKVDDAESSRTSIFNLAGQHTTSSYIGNIVIKKNGKNVRKVMTR